MGGIAYFATAYKQLKKENPNTVIVSTGDDLMNKYFHTYKGKVIFSLMPVMQVMNSMPLETQRKQSTL